MSRRLCAVLLLVMILAVASYAAEPFTFIHISDVHVNSQGKHTEKLRAIADEIEAMNPKPALVVCTGDLVEVGFESEFQQYKAAMESFGVPVYNVSGNHETKWSNWGKFGPTKFLGQDPYYSFDHGGVHFVGLDSALWLEHYGILDQHMLTWLKADLEKAGKDTPSVLFYHHMPGFIPNEDQLLRTIRPFNVKLILVGHGHNFKTWRKNGVLFQEVKGVMNAPGGYRILEVTGDEIKSYTKITGGEKTADGTVSLKPTTNPVSLLRPKTGRIVEGQVQVRARVGALMEKVEYAVDGDYKPIERGRSGIYEAKSDFSGTPGRHLVSVRATDKDGMEWSDAAWVRIGAGGKEAWHINVSGAIERPIRADGDRLYFGCWGGDVYCLDARTGKEIWRKNVGADTISYPAVSDGLVFLGSVNGKILALNADTGKQAWEYKTDGPVLGSPAVGEGKVFIGSGDCSFYAIDANTGDLAWRYEMKRMNQTVPIYMNGVVYFGAWDGHFHAVSAATGKDVWLYKTGDTLYWSPSNSDPSTDGKSIVVTAYQGETPGAPDVFCIDLKTGGEIWKRKNPGGKSLAIFNSPMVVGDRFYLPDVGGNLYCMRMSDGGETWRTTIGQTSYDNWPVYADGKLYVSGLRGNLVCFDAATGDKEWTYSTGNGYLLASPTVWKDLVIVPSMDGTVTAVKR